MSIKELLEYLNIEVFYINSNFSKKSSLLKKNKTFASVQLYMNNFYIYIDNMLLDDEHQFLHDYTLLHEIGHIVEEHLDSDSSILSFLSENNKNTYYVTAKIEREANRFAINYLKYRDSVTTFEIKQFLFEAYDIHI